MAVIEDLLSIDQLPVMPASLSRVLPLLLDPDSEIDDIEKIVRQDEALASTVLRLANSAQFGVPGKQFDLRRAVARLGRDRLRRCILQQQVASVANAENAAFGLQRGALWRSSLGGAIAAETVADTCGFNDPSLAFVCGLLRDIGKLVLNLKYGQEYLGLISRQAAPRRSFVEAERLALGFDHADVGAALARKWGLPSRIALAIQHHHAPPSEKPSHDQLFDIVHAADVICLWAGLGVGVDGLEYKLADHVRCGLHINRASVERIIEIVWSKLREAADSNDELNQQGVAA